MTENNLHDHIVAMQQSWHGWGSPIGLSLGFAVVVGSTAALVAALRHRTRT